MLAALGLCALVAQLAPVAHAATPVPSARYAVGVDLGSERIKVALEVALSGIATPRDTARPEHKKPRPPLFAGAHS